MKNKLKEQNTLFPALLLIMFLVIFNFHIQCCAIKCMQVSLWVRNSYLFLHGMTFLETTLQKGVSGKKRHQ